MKGFFFKSVLLFYSFSLVLFNLYINFYGDLKFLLISKDFSFKKTYWNKNCKLKTENTQLSQNLIARCDL